MQRRAEKLMRDYCVSLGQNLDQPVVEYLASLLIEAAEGEVMCETLTELMNEFSTKTVRSNEVRQLIELVNAHEAVKAENPLKNEAHEVQKGAQSTLNATAPAFEPRSLREMDRDGQGQCLVQMDLVDFIETYLQDPENDPLNLLASIFPAMEASEIEKEYQAQNKSFVWTLDALMTMKEGFEPVSRARKPKEAMEPSAVIEPAVPVDVSPVELDLSEEAFPELPGQKQKPSGHCGSRKTTFLDIAKKKRPPARIAKPPPRSPPDPHDVNPPRQNSRYGGPIPWVVTGEAVSKEYAKLRADASEFAKLRNACFCEATKAYVGGNKALAKELGEKGRRYCEKMKQCHYDASEAIFRSRNTQLKRMCNNDSPEVLDLHGLHVAEARRILTRELGSRRGKKPRGRRKIIHLLVGTGHHTKGAKTPSRLPTAVQSLLVEEGYTYHQSRPGVIEVDL